MTYQPIIRLLVINTETLEVEGCNFTRAAEITGHTFHGSAFPYRVGNYIVTLYN